MIGSAMPVRIEGDKIHYAYPVTILAAATPASMSIPAPFERYEGEVLPEWIDANDHMNLAYYTVLFDYATDALFDAIGIGRQYKDSTGNGTFVAETHNLYERELLLGDRVRVGTQILGMRRQSACIWRMKCSWLPSGQRAATQELMYLHVDLSARRVVAVSGRGAGARARARGGARPSSRPDWTGRRIAMPM